MAVESDMPDLFQRGFERDCITECRDVGGRDNSPHIPKAPGAKWCLAPIGQRHQPVGLRRIVVHQGRAHFSSSISLHVNHATIYLLRRRALELHNLGAIDTTSPNAS